MHIYFLFIVVNYGKLYEILMGRRGEGGRRLLITIQIVHQNFEIIFAPYCEICEILLMNTEQIIYQLDIEY